MFKCVYNVYGIIVNLLYVLTNINKAEKYESYISMYHNPYTYVFTHMLRHKQYVYIHSYKCDK